MFCTTAMFGDILNKMFHHYTSTPAIQQAAVGRDADTSPGIGGASKTLYQ